MNLRPWELWSLDGTPAPDTLELVSVLESVLRRYPNHPGANHYYIHAVEASPTPERALASAARLETLVPGAGHLVHMPTHIYMHTGDLDRIASLNQKAADADEHYFSLANPEGVYPFMYYAHNLHFVVVGHLATGRYDDSRAGREEDGGPGGAARRARWRRWRSGSSRCPTLADVRFQQWDAILSAPQPPGIADAGPARSTTTRAQLALQSTGKRDGGRRRRPTRVRGRPRHGERRDGRRLVQLRTDSARRAERAAEGAAGATTAPTAEPHLQSADRRGRTRSTTTSPRRLPWSVRESLGAALLAGGPGRRGGTGVPRGSGEEPREAVDRCSVSWPASMRKAGKTKPRSFGRNIRTPGDSRRTR